MKKLVTTYGKTWHTWQVDRGDKIPLGLPKLMMGFTADGQIDPKIIEKRDTILAPIPARKSRNAPRFQLMISSLERMPGKQRKPFRSLTNK